MSPYFQKFFSPAEFAARRARIAERIGGGASAVLAGGGERGSFEFFRQYNEFFYLSGVEAPHAYLKIDGADAKTSLYLSARDVKHEASDGPQLNCDLSDVARAVTGVDEVKPLAALAADVRTARKIFVPLQPCEGRQGCRDTALFARRCIAADPWDARDSQETHFENKLSAAAPSAEIFDLTPILDDLRLIKSAREIDAMRFAGKLSAQAAAEAMKSARPGLHEFHLAAVAEYVYALNGARGGSYRPIVASGKNIWNMHYYRNDCELKSGANVLFDYAPDFNYYTSDIGRFFPVNGRFDEVARQLYGFVAKFHRALLGHIRPGLMPSEVMRNAALEMESSVADTRWLKSSYETAAREMLKFQGHLSHSVGMAVHDPSVYHDRPLSPGAVFALDPQLWVRDGELYIRVEDTVLVTENGAEVLTAGAPFEIDEIEAAVGRGGMLQSFPPQSNA